MPIGFRPEVVEPESIAARQSKRKPLNVRFLVIAFGLIVLVAAGLAWSVAQKRDTDAGAGRQQQPAPSSVAPTDFTQQIEALRGTQPEHFPATAEVFTAKMVKQAVENGDGQPGKMKAVCTGKVTNLHTETVTVHADLLFVSEDEAQQFDMSPSAGGNEIKPGQSKTFEEESTEVPVGAAFKCTIGDVFGYIPTA